MRIAVYGNHYQENRAEELMRLFDALSRHNVWIEMEESFYRYLSELLPSPPAVNDIIKGNDFNAALAISIGGDGTFLRTAQWVGEKNIPILGINTGHLGYLTAFTSAQAPEYLPEILAGDYKIEPRTMLMVTSDDADIPIWNYALNEVAILKQDTASMIDMDTWVNEVMLANYLADGLIISTPTGSTGYNLSIGGPVVEPSSPVWVISPIAAHSLSMRPLVVNDNSEITVLTRSRGESYRLSLDGRSISLPVNTTVRISKAPFVTGIVLTRSHTFTDTLRNKLFWGMDKRQ